MAPCLTSSAPVVPQLPSTPDPAQPPPQARCLQSVLTQMGPALQSLAKRPFPSRTLTFPRAPRAQRGSLLFLPEHQLKFQLFILAACSPHGSGRSPQVLPGWEGEALDAAVASRAGGSLPPFLWDAPSSVAAASLRTPPRYYRNFSKLFSPKLLQSGPPQPVPDWLPGMLRPLLQG